VNMQKHCFTSNMEENIINNNKDTVYIHRSFFTSEITQGLI